MIGKTLVALGVWVLCDGIFSIHVYWGKENIREHYIRVIRVIAGIAIALIGFSIEDI